MMTEMSLPCATRAQHLEIGCRQTQPSGPLRRRTSGASSVKDGKLLLPLEQSVGDEAAIPSIWFMSARIVFLKRGTMELISPQLDAR